MPNERIRVAVLDDWQGIARQSADWTKLQQQADIVFFEEPFAGPDKLAKALAEFDIIIAMRERTKFSRELIDRLPKLRMIALTGGLTYAIPVARNPAPRPPRSRWAFCYRLRDS